MTRSRKAQKKDPKPRQVPLRLRLDEEVFDLLQKDASASYRPRSRHAELLLENAIRASWAYQFCKGADIGAVKSAREFFSELYRLQAKALKEIERASIAAKNAAGAAAGRCQHFLDARKAHQADSATGRKVLGGKFGSASKGSAA